MPKGPLGHHSKYINGNFSLRPHGCVGDCACVATGCTLHWHWDNAAPPCTDVDKEMHLFSAYRGNVAGPKKRQRFLTNYRDIVQWVRPLDGATIFCNWDSKVVADVFNKVKKVFDESTVTVSKALYFFVPDLFIILDRQKVWRPWRRECVGVGRWPRGLDIDDVTGENYVELLDHIRVKISSAIKGGMAFTLNGSLPVSVKSIDDLRLVTPLQLNIPKLIGHTLGQVIDNIIRRNIPGAGSTIPSSSLPPNS